MKVYLTFLLVMAVSPAFVFAQSTPDPAFTELFRRNGPGWNAGDATISVPLSDGRTIWLFGDSYLHQNIGADNQIPCFFQVRNCMMVQSAGANPSFETQVDGAQSGLLRTTFKYGSDNQLNHYMWPGHGFQQGDFVYIFFQRWHDAVPSDAAVSPAGSFVAQLAYPSLELLSVDSLSFPLPFKMGKAVLAGSDGWLYVYHAKTDTLGSFIGERPYLSRTPLSAPFSQWEHRGTNGWGSQTSSLAPLTSYFVSASFSVFPMDGKYYLLTQQPLGILCGNGREIYLSEADTPWGSFALRKWVYTVEDQYNGSYLATYNAQAHPSFTDPAGLLVSYNVNDPVASSCPSQCANGNTRDADTYRPKFIRVPLGDLRVSEIMAQCDLFLLAGQSNAVGQGDASLSPSVAQETAYQLNMVQGILYPMKDPLGFNDALFGFQQASTGSIGPAFCEAYKNTCGRRPILLSTAVSESSCHAVPNPNFNWSQSGQLFNRSKARVNTALSLTGIPQLSGVVWMQGESDAAAIRNGLLSANEYRQALEDLVGRFRTDFGAALPFLVVQTGRNYANPDDLGFADVRAAQSDLANADPGTWLVYDSTQYFGQLGLMSDFIHYNQAGLNQIGASVGEKTCLILTDQDGDGANALLDCDDGDAAINLAAMEIPNNAVDEDCDGIALVIDGDADGFNSDLDCNDGDAAINPAATEIPNNAVDEDCDGIALVIDGDGDGFNSDLDCNDGDAAINPTAAEIPNNAVDEDCDGIALVIDMDGDGFNSDLDCNDGDAAINPATAEIPNNAVDEDCDGIALVIDGDGDGFNSDLDCDDGDAAINPCAAEVFGNGTDEDCDSLDGTDPVGCANFTFQSWEIVETDTIGCALFLIYSIEITCTDLGVKAVYPVWKICSPTGNYSVLDTLTGLSLGPGQMGGFNFIHPLPYANAADTCWQLSEVSVHLALVDYEYVVGTEEQAFSQTVEVFPNPVSSNQINLRFNGQPQAIERVLLRNPLGQSWSLELDCLGNMPICDLILPTGLPTGFYLLELEAMGNRHVVKVIVQ